MKKVEYLINGKPFSVEILSFDGRRADVRVNNIPYAVEVPQGPAAGAPAYTPPSPAVPPPVPVEPPRAAVPKTPEAVPAPPPVVPVPAAPAPAQASSENVIVAPMPGIILSVLVEDGDVVSADDVILVLEAMKMENEIHAPRAGKVKKVHVNEGAEVRAGAKLLELE